MNWFFVIGAISLALIYIELHLGDEGRTMLCAVILGIPMIIILFINRPEPKLIKFDDESVEITYVVQPPFGRATKVYVKTGLTINKTNDLINISDGSGTVTKLRRKAVNDKDWKTLQEYFC